MDRRSPDVLTFQQDSCLVDFTSAVRLQDTAETGLSREVSLAFASAEDTDATVEGFAAPGRLSVAEVQLGKLAVRREVFRPGDAESELAVRLVVHNEGDEAVWVEELLPVVAGPDGVRLGEESAGQWVFLRQPRFKNDMPAAVILGQDSPALRDAVRGLEESGAVSADAPSVLPHEFTSGEVLGLAGPGGCFVAGQVPLDRQVPRSTLAMSPERKALCRLDVRCDCGGARLDPGQSIEGQWVWMWMGEAFSEGLDRYAERLMSSCLPGGRPRREVRAHPTVWCSWYYYGESFVQMQAEQNLAELKRRKLPVDVFLIDECWDRRWGDWQPNDDWPDLPGLAQRIRQAGLAPGIWTCPTLVEPRARLRIHRPDWLLRDRAGQPTRFFMNETNNYVLDPTHPEVLAWTEELYRRLRHEWGFVYHKIDFSRSIVMGRPRYHDPTRTPAEVYGLWARAVRRGLGPEAYLSLCGGQFGPAIGIADAQRTGSDVRAEWPAPPAGEEAWGYGPFTIRQSSLRYWMNRLWDNDADALMVRRRSESINHRHLSLGLLSDEEALTSTLNQYLAGGLVCFTENLSEIQDDRLMLLRHCCPSLGVSARPADLADGPRFPAVLISPVPGRGEYLPACCTVALINWFEEPREFSLTFDRSLLGDQADVLGPGPLAVGSFRGRPDRAVTPGETITVGPIPSHGCEVLRVQPLRTDGPMVLGTDGHFSMGGAEFGDLQPTETGVRLEVDWPWPVGLSVRLCRDGDLNKAETFRIPPATTGTVELTWGS